MVFGFWILVVVVVLVFWCFGVLIVDILFVLHSLVLLLLSLLLLLLLFQMRVLGRDENAPAVAMDEITMKRALYTVR